MQHGQMNESFIAESQWGK